ncbi:MAG TPA: hypothetical protein DIW81_10815 [Planctomycetaceae bacterium]|nr:hypothetical protein [Rubinisphaera sp.]HCS52068.1 hypothetical protein [Planctomycetaceae bacterium]
MEESELLLIERIPTRLRFTTFDFAPEQTRIFESRDSSCMLYSGFSMMLCTSTECVAVIW